MRGLAWWNGKCRSSWGAMERSTSPFQREKKGKRTARKTKSKGEYPKIRKSAASELERNDVATSDKAGVLVVCMFVCIVASLAAVSALAQPLYTALAIAPGAGLGVWFWARQKRRSRAIDSRR